MFSDNEKISERQLGRLLTLDLFGMTSLLLPKILCNTARRDGLLSLGIGLVFLSVYIFLMSWNIKLSKGNILTYVRGCLGKNCTDFVLLLFIMQTLLLGGFALGMCGALVRSVLLPGADIRLIIISFWIIAIYGASKGVEPRGRMAEVLFWAFLIPFLLVLLVASRGIRREFFPPALTTDAINILKGGYEVLAVFQGILFTVFVLPYLSKKECIMRCVRKGILWNSILCAALFVILVGVFGIPMVSRLPWPAISLMTTMGLYGGFVRRLDIFMITIWIFAFYFLVSGSMLYANNLTEKLLEKKNHLGIRIIVAVFLLLFGLVLKDYPSSYEIYKTYMFCIGIPFVVLLMLLLPLIATVKAYRKGGSTT